MFGINLGGDFWINYVEKMCELLLYIWYQIYVQDLVATYMSTQYINYVVYLGIKLN